MYDLCSTLYMNIPSVNTQTLHLLLPRLCLLSRHRVKLKVDIYRGWIEIWKFFWHTLCPVIQRKKNSNAKSSLLTLWLSCDLLKSHLGVCNGQRVDPHPPASPFIFDRMVEQDPKDVVDHLSYFLLLWVLGVDVSKGEHPVLPHRALQQAAGIQHKHYVNWAVVWAQCNNPSKRQMTCCWINTIFVICVLLPPVFTAVTKEFYHIGKKESPDFHQLSAGWGVLEQGGHNL